MSMSTQNERELARDRLAEAIGEDAFDCTRVWSAWGVGTMSEDDFVSIINDDNRLDEILDHVCAPLLSRIAEMESRIDALSKDAEPDNGYAITHDPCRAYLSFFKDGVEVAHIGIEYILDGRFSQKAMTEKERELLLGIYHAAISAREGE